MSLWRNFTGNVLQTVVEVFFLISAIDVHWRVQPTAARSKMHGLCTHYTCLSTMPLWEMSVCKWLKKNNGHLITHQIWIPWICYVLAAMHKAILKPSSEAQNNFWIKSHTEEDMGQFSTGPINKSVLSFTNSLTRVHEGWEKTFWAFVSTRENVHITVFALS